jgi:2-iminobutanoate/2-iminopropanoate deaminase
MTSTLARHEVFLPELPAPISHYTHAVVFDGIVYVSGLIAHRPASVAPESWDAPRQARAILEDLRRVLAEVDATLSDVLRVTVYVIDIADRPRINPVRQELFGASRPASTLVQVAALADPEARLEIEAIARTGPGWAGSSSRGEAHEA